MSLLSSLVGCCGDSGGGGGGVPTATDTLGTGVNYNVTGVTGFTALNDPAMDGFTFVMIPSATNTGTTPQLQVNGLGYSTIVRTKVGTGAIYVGDIATYVPALFCYSYNYSRWHLINPVVDGRPFNTVSSNTSLQAGQDYNITASATYWIPGGGGANDPGSKFSLLITSTSDITLDISSGGSTVRFLNNTGTTSLVCNPVSGTAQGHFIEFTNISFNNWVVTKYSGTAADWTLT